MEYLVVYKIDVDADNPKEAALQAEKLMKEGFYRPHFQITDSNGVMTDVNLDQELVEE